MYEIFPFAHGTASLLRVDHRPQAGGQTGARLWIASADLRARGRDAAEQALTLDARALGGQDSVHLAAHARAVQVKV